MNHQKKIAIFTPRLVGGGAERVLQVLAGGFSKHGFAVDFLVKNTLNFTGEPGRRTYRIINFSKSRMIKTLFPLVKYLRDEKPHILISGLELPNALSILATKLAGSGNKVIATIHSLESFYATNASSPKRKLEILIMRLLSRHASHLVAVSEDVARNVSEFYKVPLEKVRMIANPIPLDEINLKSREKLSHPFFVHARDPIIISIGRLEPEKDHATLIKAFHLVRSKRPSKLIILGEGSKRQSLETLISDLNLERDVSLPGYLQNPYPFLKEADLFVLSSLWEGFGLVLVEAMALGCPIVSTNCPGGVAKILDNGKYGHLVPVREPQLMAASILKALLVPKKPVPSAWISQFSLDEVVKQYIDLIES